MLEAFLPKTVKIIFDEVMSKRPFIYAYIAFKMKILAAKNLNSTKVTKAIRKIWTLT